MKRETNQSENVILTLRTEALNLESDDSETEESSNENIFYDDIPGDQTCEECIKKDLIISQYRDKLREARQESEATKLYCISNPPVTDGKALVKTKIDCWYHGRRHENLVCPLIDKRVGNKWFTIGSFCSPNCALGYNFSVLNDSRVYDRMSLTKQWLRKVCDLPLETPLDIPIAGNCALLKHRGGTMTIEKFRAGFTFLDKGTAPNTSPSNITIDNRKHEQEMIDHNELVLYRNKPLPHHKSILKVMGRK